MCDSKQNHSDNRFYKDGELNDAQIELALIQAVSDWQDGAIVEMRDTLVNIVNAIDYFVNESQKKG